MLFVSDTFINPKYIFNYLSCMVAKALISFKLALLRIIIYKINVQFHVRITSYFMSPWAQSDNEAVVRWIFLSYRLILSFLFSASVTVTQCLFADPYDVTYPLKMNKFPVPDSCLSFQSHQFQFFFSYVYSFVYCAWPWKKHDHFGRLSLFSWEFSLSRMSCIPCLLGYSNTGARFVPSVRAIILLIIFYH